MENIVCLAGLACLLVPLLILFPIHIKHYYSLMCSGLLATSGLILAIHTIVTGSFVYPILSLPFIGDILFEADLLSSVFILIVSVIGLLGAIYSVGFHVKEKDAARLDMFYIAYNFMLAAMLQVTLLQNFVAFLIMWEIMSFCSFALVIFEHGKMRTVKAALNYLIHMHIGVTVLMLAVILVFNHTGDAHFAALAVYFKDKADLPLFLLFFIGFGFKLALLPLHTWSPETYAAAPPQASAVMSGAMKKLGIYGVVRVLTHVQDGQLEIGMFLIIMGCTAAIYGIVNSVVQNDMKRALAYSSIENIGLIVLGLGIGFLGIGVQDYSLAYLGLCGALLHTINHSMIKTLLFMAVGGIQFSVNIFNMNQLGGLIKKMPITALIFLIASVSISGLPPFNGFISEFLLYGAIFEGLNATNVVAEVFLLIALIIMALVGGLSIYNYTKMFGLSFLGTPRSERSLHAQEVNYWLLAPQFILVAAIFSVDMLPFTYISLLNNTVHMFVPKTHLLATRIFDASQNIAMISFVFFALVTVLYLIRQIAVTKENIMHGPTWGCGYTVKSSKVQYTSSSFNYYLQKFAAPLIGSVNKYNSLQKTDIFPKDHLYDTHTYDLLERNIVRNLIIRSEKGMQYFAFLQTGKTQHYIIYGFGFLLLLFALTFTNLI